MEDRDPVKTVNSVYLYSALLHLLPQQPKGLVGKVYKSNVNVV